MASGFWNVVYDSKEPELVFEFRYRSMEILQASGIVPPPKRETPPIIDAEDEDILPPPKRQKGQQSDDYFRSMKVRNSLRVKPTPFPNNRLNGNRLSWTNCDGGWSSLKGRKAGLLL
jgi:hypothetical protein